MLMQDVMMIQSEQTHISEQMKIKGMWEGGRVIRLSGCEQLQG